MEIERNNSAKYATNRNHLLETKYANKLQFYEKLYMQ